MYISENRSAPELGGFLDTVMDAVNWGLDTAKSIATTVSAAKPSVSTPSAPKAPAPAPAPVSTAAKATVIGLPLILGGGVLLYFLMKKK